MTYSPQNPFVRDATQNKPGIIGARWWNHALQVGSSSSSRRGALIAIGVAAVGAVAIGGLMVYGIARSGSSADEAVTEQPRRALDMQRDYGWNFGAVSETVVFDTLYTQAYAREALKTLEGNLAPKGSRHTSHYVPSLFQSPEALPRLTLPDGDTARVTPLAEALRPILTPRMTEYERRGEAYGKLVAGAEQAVLTVVDLPGPEAVAFAAGASKYLDPIFLFDNWPHPRGVVPAHETLAAAVYYQPLFTKTQGERAPAAMPMAVIDRNRLNAYVDDNTKFDNRYLAKVPAPAAVGAKHVMYVVESSTDLPEKDDLNQAFVEWNGGGTDVRAVAASAFSADSSGEWLFGGSAEKSASFFYAYPWQRQKGSPGIVPANGSAWHYRPEARPAARTVVSPDPGGGGGGIGYVPVMVAVGTGVLVGSRLNRNGSWNRTSGNYGGG